MLDEAIPQLYRDEQKYRYRYDIIYAYMNIQSKEGYEIQPKYL